MKKETRHYIQELAYFSTIGLSVALSIFIGLAIGVYLGPTMGNDPMANVNLFRAWNRSWIQKHRLGNKKEPKIVNMA